MNEELQTVRQDIQVKKAQKRLGITVGRNVRHYRRSKSLSQSQLARKAGTTQSSIARCEAGNQLNYTTEYLLKISNVLGIKPEALLKYRPEEKV